MSSTMPQSSRSQNPEAVKRNILDVARTIFAAKGYSGARVDEIAEATSTSKSMIYYYFKDKDGLYKAVLEEAYRAVRRLDSATELVHLPPIEALTRLIEITFDYHFDTPDFVRLVMIENIHKAENLKMMKDLSVVNQSALDMLDKIYQNGVERNLFRRGLTALNIHLTMSALSFYNVSNSHSINAIFGYDSSLEGSKSTRKQAITEAVLRYVRKINDENA
jgi:AcrR family transcriptional regulator